MPINDIKLGIDKGVAAVGLKVLGTVEKSRIKVQIAALDVEVRELQLKIGKSVYEMWAENNVELSGLNADFEVVKEKVDSIRALQKEYSEADEKEHSVQKTEHFTNIFCVQCGEKYDTPVKFCRKCGAKIISE